MTSGVDPVAAGKTSLTDRLLHAAGVIDEVGRVDDGNTRTDSLALERQRGITIKAAVVSFDIAGTMVNLIDTPGQARIGEQRIVSWSIRARRSDQDGTELIDFVAASEVRAPEPIPLVGYVLDKPDPVEGAVWRSDALLFR